MTGPRRGYSLIELLVVLAILATLVLLLLPGMQKVREASARAHCQNNLKHLGLALHHYHDVFKMFPAEGSCQGVSWYTRILPYVEQAPLYDQIWPAFQAAIEASPDDASQAKALYASAARQVTPDHGAVAIFLCPSRRSPMVGARDDYAGACQDGITEADLNGELLPDGSKVDSTGYRTILDTRQTGATPSNVSLARINAAAGASSTLLLAHGSRRPSSYLGGGANDAGWVWTRLTGGSHDHMRWADSGAHGTNAGRGYFADDDAVDENYLGGPHANASPVLFADGSVRDYRYGYVDPQSGLTSEDAVFQALWAWNRVINVTAP